MATDLLDLPEISVSQSNKYATHNLGLRQLESRLTRVLSRTTTAQPGSPSSGDNYIVPDSATGTDWAGEDGKIASYINAAWYFYDPIEGIRIGVTDEDVIVRYSGTDWTLDSVDPMLSKDCAGSSDVTLTDSESSNRVQEYTGALTGNINVIVPNDKRRYYVFNNTSGAFTLTVKTSGGTGIAVGQSNRAILYCDGTNVVRFAADV
jgi:hypothetical protein